MGVPAARAWGSEGNYLKIIRRSRVIARAVAKLKNVNVWPALLVELRFPLRSAESRSSREPDQRSPRLSPLWRPSRANFKAAADSGEYAFPRFPGSLDRRFQFWRYFLPVPPYPSVPAGARGQGLGAQVRLRRGAPAAKISRLSGRGEPRRMRACRVWPPNPVRTLLRVGPREIRSNPRDRRAATFR